MTRCLLPAFGAVLLCACALVPHAAAAAVPACAATASQASQDPRIRQAVEEARRQHQLFGGQTIERNGGMFHVGYHEAEWDRPPGESTPAWERVATFWRALSEFEPPALVTSVGRVRRAEVASAAATASTGTRAEVAVREALLRTAIVDTPWSAAFISYLMKTAGFSRAEFEFSDSHADYVRAALAASAAEAAGRDSTQAFRACDIATTRPRAGDLICATRASSAGTAKFAALSAALAATSASQAFPMHCDLVVRSDEGGDAKLESIGGNVVNSVTLSRMTLNARKVPSAVYITGAAPGADCSRVRTQCRENLSRRPWVVLLQFRR
ncbi:DUF2272 domain-containing protein [Ramlibacter sp.]|uniref:DUF2272 domain-containing protein n=1 Tax=Ramlibacter sp. TaxID=1917967 RepID=UPI00260E8688|nr:DUF2272 domain-containing protein [Ramlibacter sp.]MDB5958216.1 putative secreted protein [Ramlibacter sp.]